MEENIADALLMAGAMLIFIIALTFSMSSFTDMRIIIDEIFQYDSKIDLITDESHNYLNYMTAGDNTTRTVGIETVMSSIYRVQKENFKIYINTKSNLGLEEIDFTDKYNSKSKVNNPYTYGISINSNIDYSKIYNELEEKKFTEYLGIYQDNTQASSVNKITYRVITYIETN